MIEASAYIDTVRSLFSFLEEDFGFVQKTPAINGNAFYDLEYESPDLVVSISYENIEDCLEVILFKLEEGKMPDYDDKTRTLHLKELSNLVRNQLGEEGLRRRHDFGENFEPSTQLERDLLRGAGTVGLYLSSRQQSSNFLP